MDCGRINGKDGHVTVIPQGACLTNSILAKSSFDRSVCELFDRWSVSKARTIICLPAASLSSLRSVANSPDMDCVDADGEAEP